MIFISIIFVCLTALPPLCSASGSFIRLRNDRDYCLASPSSGSGRLYLDKCNPALPNQRFQFREGDLWAANVGGACIGVNRGRDSAIQAGHTVQTPCVGSTQENTWSGMPKPRPRTNPRYVCVGYSGGLSVGSAIVMQHCSTSPEWEITTDIVVPTQVPTKQPTYIRVDPRVCARYCNKWTCASTDCRGCSFCLDEWNGCANWCNPYTCSSPQCRSCATCIGGGNRQCESWCNQWTFRSPSCFGCPSMFSAEEVGEDPADKPAYCDHVPENVTQFMLECSANDTMEDGSSMLCNFLTDGAKGCLEDCGGALDGPECALPEPEVWCGNLPEVAIPYIDICKDVIIAPPATESDATKGSEVTEESGADITPIPKEEASSEDTTSGSGLTSTSGILLAVAFGVIGMISLYF